MIWHWIRNDKRNSNRNSNRKKRDLDLERYEGVRVADMNVEGMPWYRKVEDEDEVSGVLGEGRDGVGEGFPLSEEMEGLSRGETGRVLVTSLLAALLVGFVFLGGIFLFLVFCVNVWLR